MYFSGVFGTGDAKKKKIKTAKILNVPRWARELAATIGENGFGATVWVKNYNKKNCPTPLPIVDRVKYFLFVYSRLFYTVNPISVHCIGLTLSRIPREFRDSTAGRPTDPICLLGRSVYFRASLLPFSPPLHVIRIQ